MGPLATISFLLRTEGSECRTCEVGHVACPVHDLALLGSADDGHLASSALKGCTDHLPHLEHKHNISGHERETPAEAQAWGIWGVYLEQCTVMYGDDRQCALVGLLLNSDEKQRIQSAQLFEGGLPFMFFDSLTCLKGPIM